MPRRARHRAALAAAGQHHHPHPHAALGTAAISSALSIRIFLLIYPGFGQHCPDCSQNLKAGLEQSETSGNWGQNDRSEEHTSELQSLMRISYAVFCLKKKTNESNE